MWVHNTQIFKATFWRTLPATLLKLTLRRTLLANFPSSLLPACNCHPLGSVGARAAGDALCDPSDGGCICKPGVGGARCDRCMVGYWGFHQYGCRPCDCAGDCDPFTGDCVLG